jgi:hypothetical protein
MTKAEVAALKEFLSSYPKKKERQTTIIGDLTPACGCADATLVLATTAPAIRRQDWDSNPQPLGDKLNRLPTELPRSYDLGDIIYGDTM